jgi:hypothetical protein
MELNPSRNREEKRMSILTKNIDVNLYRAYKGALGGKIDGQYKI